MALQFSTSYRNAFLDQLETTAGQSEVLKIFTGSVPATCATADSGTKLVEFDLAASGDWVAASGGTKTLSSLTLSTTAAAAGTMGYFRLYASNGTTCHMQGTVTATGGGGDLTYDQIAVVLAQAIQLTGFTLTAPGA